MPLMSVSKGRIWAVLAGSVAAATIVGGVMCYLKRKSKHRSATSREPEAPRKSLEKAMELNEQGNKCFKVCRYSDAVKLFTEAIQTCPLDTPPDVMGPFFVDRAAAEEKLGMDSECIDDTTKALEGNPICVRSLTLRSLAYRNLGRHEESQQDVATLCTLANLNYSPSPTPTDNLKKRDRKAEKERKEKRKETTGATATSTTPSAPATGKRTTKPID